jgi:hypothetical protein
MYGDRALQFRLVKDYTFEKLLLDASKLFGINPDDTILADEKGRIWPLSCYVAEELTQDQAVIYMKNRFSPNKSFCTEVFN